MYLEKKLAYDNSFLRKPFTNGKGRHFLRRPIAEKMGFEPMHRLPDDRISSAARYDHFDTSPYDN